MGQVIRTWPSSKPGKQYELTMGDDGILYCTCMAWKFCKARPRICKHITEWTDAIAKGGAVFAIKVPT
jgi:hypothetical protein